jgi:hypothetical protein
MRSDNSAIKPNPVNPYNAATEKAFAAQRPSQARKKSVKRETGGQAWTGSAQSLMIGQWMSAGRGRALAKDSHHADASGKDLDFE